MGVDYISHFTTVPLRVTGFWRRRSGERTRGRWTTAPRSPRAETRGRLPSIGQLLSVIRAAFEPFEHRACRIGRIQFRSRPANSSPASPVASQNPYAICPSASLTAPIASGADHRRDAREAENDAGRGAVLAFRDATDAFRIERRIDDGHEEAERGQQINSHSIPLTTLHTKQTKMRRSWPRRQVACHRSRRSIHAPESAAARSAKKTEMPGVAAHQRGAPVGPATSGGHPNVNRRQRRDEPRGGEPEDVRDQRIERFRLPPRLEPRPPTRYPPRAP